jgi:[ribosomal protein S5]-alanine N-acetyltransferase
MIDAGLCVLRAWEELDIETVAALANDWEVARYLSDRFPHPYMLDDARGWINRNRSIVPTEQFAIEVAGDHTFATTDAVRLETHVYAPNFMSAGVLEKCGYLREGVLRSAITKGKNIYDAYLYAKVRS